MHRIRQAFAMPFSRMGAAALIGSTVILLQPSPLSAQARPDTRTMTCEQAKARVKAQGGLVMTTGQNTYQRFVATHQFCFSPTDVTQPAFAPTRDNARCDIGFTCRDRSANAQN